MCHRASLEVTQIGRHLASGSQGSSTNGSFPFRNIRLRLLMVPKRPNDERPWRQEDATHFTSAQCGTVTDNVGYETPIDRAADRTLLAYPIYPLRYLGDWRFVRDTVVDMTLLHNSGYHIEQASTPLCQGKCVCIRHQLLVTDSQMQ